MKTVVVTGGAGFIGAHTCKRLYQSGYNPVTYDNLSTGHKDFVKWGDLVVGDLQDLVKLTDTLVKYTPVAVIHFAASAYVGESVENPLKYYRNNVGGSLCLVEAMANSKIRHLVFSSSCATYGKPNKKIIDELTSQQPINPYGRSKLMFEQILQDLSIANQISYIALRFFNASGADKEAEIGELHEPETHLIPLAIQSANGGDKLKIFGTDFATDDGTAVRDYVHVEDLADGHINALEYLLSGGSSETVNLGTGKGTSVYEVIRSLQNLGESVSYENSVRRIGDPSFLVADISKAFRLLKWKPKYPEINTTLLHALNWHKKNGF
jgi:UDP-arabinose 4-epimerase